MSDFKKKKKDRHMFIYAYNFLKDTNSAGLALT